MLNIPYIQDPSHGWAIVKRDLLPKLRLNEEDFPYSYISPKGEFIALEEDCEMPVLLCIISHIVYIYNIRRKHKVCLHSPLGVKLWILQSTMSMTSRLIRESLKVSL